VKLKWVMPCLCLVSFSLVVLSFPRECESQYFEGMPKYQITGLVELDYLDFSTSLNEKGVKSDSGTTNFIQQYRLGIDGYIKTPKLAIYSVNVGFKYFINTSTASGMQDVHSHESDIDYNLTLNLLPLRPVSLDIYAARSTGVVTDGGTFDTAYNSYGLTLRAQLPDILKKKGSSGGGGDLVAALPLVAFHFDHYDYDFGNGGGKSSINDYDLDMRGVVKSLRTRYLLGYEITDYTNSSTSYEIQEVRSTTITSLTGNKSLVTLFSYTDGNNTKAMFASADLSLNPASRFSQEYRYYYYGYDTEGTRSDTHEFTGAWSYIFSNRFRSRAYAYYSLTSSSDSESEEMYGSTATLNYNTPIKRFNFKSDYNVTYKHDSLIGDFTEQSVDLDLRTRKLQWGAVFANYTFTYATATNEQDVTEQVVLGGVEGKGPGRAAWVVEGYYLNASNNISAFLPTGVGESLTTGTGRSSYYSLLAEVSYPLVRNGKIYLRGEYASGTANAAELRTMYYEAQLLYNPLRNLSLMAWWRQGWDKSQTFFDSKVTEYEARLYYRLRRVYLSLEYRRWKTVDLGPVTTDISTFFVRLVRPI